MKKIISLPKKYSDDTLKKVNGVLLGIKDLSIGFNEYETTNTILEKIEHIKSLGNEVFISLNKNMYNEDLEYLKKVLIMLDDKVNGIFYYDISVFNIVKTLKLNIKLYWSQEHLTNNYNTCNFWQKRGVTGVVLSNDITYEEIEEIRKNTSLKIVFQIYGYVKMMASSRKLVSNYLKHVNMNMKDVPYKIHERISEKEYQIIEDENGTITLTDKCINGINYIDDLQKINIDYIFLDFISIDDADEILDAFNENNKSYFTEKEEYFLSKETIYKVKK